MPHERGLLPVPPTEFSHPDIADPKARFCRSLATSQQNPRLTPGNPLTLRHLTTARYPPPECLALPWLTDACVPLHRFKKRAAQTCPFPEKTGMTRKDAQ